MPADIVAAGGRAVVVLGDLTRDDEVKRIAEEAEHRLGGLDILVNNAGGTARSRFGRKPRPRNGLRPVTGMSLQRSASPIVCSPGCGPPGGAGW